MGSPPLSRTFLSRPAAEARSPGWLWLARPDPGKSKSVLNSVQGRRAPPGFAWEGQRGLAGWLAGWLVLAASFHAAAADGPVARTHAVSVRC